ncbi:MAG: hypothetical protein LBP22_17545 [Deltaproteobacteria bacterium]|jgi:hypothetical protein|nr:hypothetical protein [Deltaproteobacteria bacterium]
MLVSSDFMAYLAKKNQSQSLTRPQIQAALASAPGGQKKNSRPQSVSVNRERDLEPSEVDYLNARTSTFEVVL